MNVPSSIGRSVHALYIRQAHLTQENQYKMVAILIGSYNTTQSLYGSTLRCNAAWIMRHMLFVISTDYVTLTVAIACQFLVEIF